jgi:outer membrane protein assembly factor BamA
MGSDFSLSGTIFRTSIRFQDFEQDQTGAEFVFGHSLTEDNRARAFARYNIQSRKIEQSSNVNAAAIIFREILGGAAASSAVAIEFAADYRDDRLAPTDGYELAGALEFAGLGFFTRYLRAEARGTFYQPAPWWMPDRSAFSFSASVGYTLPFNDLDDFTWNLPTDTTACDPVGPPKTGCDQVRSLDLIDEDSTLPLSERYFLGGLGRFQLRGFKARSVGPRRPILAKSFSNPGLFQPVGFNPDTGLCAGEDDLFQFQGNGNGRCNDIDAEDLDDFVDLDETDVIGGNKFITSSVEYRFPISDTLGLQGLFFLDTGNAFSEGKNMFDVTEWRWGTGVGVMWFSPFGPLAVILGFPLDPLSIDKSPVFEFSVGGQGF